MECLNMGAGANDDVNALRYMNLETSDENILAVSTLQNVTEKGGCEFGVTDIDKLIQDGNNCTSGSEAIDIGLLCEGEGGQLLPEVNLDEFAAGTEDTGANRGEILGTAEMLSCDSTSCLGDGVLGASGELDGEKLLIGGELIDGCGASAYDKVGRHDMDGLLLDAPVTETREVTETTTSKVEVASANAASEEGRQQIVNPDMQDVSRLMSYICSQAVLKGKEGWATMNLVGSDMSSEQVAKSCDDFDVCEMLRLYSMERSVENVMKFEALFTHGWRFEDDKQDTCDKSHDTSGETVCGLDDGEECTQIQGEDDLLPGDNLVLGGEYDGKEACGDVFDVENSEGCDARMDAVVRVEDNGLVLNAEGGGTNAGWGMVAPWWAMKGTGGTEAAAPSGSARPKRARERAATGTAAQVSDEELLRRRPKKKRRAAKFDKPVPSRFCHVCSRTPKNVRLAVCTRIQQGTCRKVICEKCFAKYGYGRFESALQMASNWLCPHCAGRCPDRAQCRTYQRINDRLRVSRLRQETAQAASAPAGARPALKL